MVFSSVQFLFVFLPLALALYYILPARARNVVLALLSLLFCVWGGVRHTALLVGFAACNWAFGLALDRTRGNSKQSPGQGPLLACAVCADVALLCFFKYSGFFVTSLNAALGTALPVLQLALPLGISFYTFQAISYCVDVARGKYEPERNPLRFFLLLGFFGHVTSGPIVTYDEQAAALDPLAPERHVDAARFCYGIKRFVLGLAKKAILADQIGLIYAQVTSVSAERLPGGVLLLGYFAYALYLYYDFSGYSDMAIGIGELFGLRLPENFDYPYMATSVGDYWRRWHITLCRFFRTYVYFPLGGSRRGTARTCLNLVIVFLLTGLWHGAAWQYVLFGLCHGLLLCAERLFLTKQLQKLPHWVSHLYTVVVLQLGLVLFGAPGLGQGLASLRGILSMQRGDAGMTFTAFADPKCLILLAAGALLCGPVQALLPRFAAWLRSEETPAAPGMVMLAALLLFSIMRVTAGNYSAFIYFQF